MNIHFISIGGSAMHNLALTLHEKGDKITGSDDEIFEPSKSRLAVKGLLPKEFGWFPEKITKNIDAIVLGMHAKADNPELIKAQKLGLKIYSYPEFLYEQSKNKTRVVIGGSHGKTTITSMILHVMDYHDIKVDYMVGAQLEGFDRMVHLTKDNDFMIIEGDEYLSSPIDRRPKFHLYKANIALLSGIAWDHMNVFPTFENYIDQFKIFIDTMVPGGIMVYNEEDEIVDKIVKEATNPIKKEAYKTPDYTIENGQVFIESSEGKIPLQIFGKHNLQNLAGAKLICQSIGVSEEEFFEAISTFSGASKRLEKLAEGKNSIIFKDFAHSPSKVKATTNAVKEQFSDKKVLACLELHTYSSLNADFLGLYKNALDAADTAVVFYSPHAVEMKKLKPISKEQIAKAFQRDDLIIYTDPKEFKDFLFAQNLENTALLFMSSGNYGGLDLEEVKSLINK
ncbi:MAG: peptidoglycan synthetase [Flavobacteriaceae bacterium]|nr:peptidoglycan synthetase [Flavobacteriaceae bacterium]